MCASLLVDHHHVNVFIRMLDFCGWSQLRDNFNSEIFPISTVCVYTLLDFSMICLQSTKD